MSKKISVVILILVLAFSLVSCGISVKGNADKTVYDYEGTGSYALLIKEDSVFLVIACPYPTSDFTHKSAKLDLANIEKYMGYTPESRAQGPVLNNILGTIGYERQYLQIAPIDISPKDAKKIARKKLSIGINITGTDDKSFYATLKYNKKIHD